MQEERISTLIGRGSAYLVVPILLHPTGDMGVDVHLDYNKYLDSILLKRIDAITLSVVGVVRNKAIEDEGIITGIQLEDGRTFRGALWEYHDNRCGRLVETAKKK